MGKEIADFNDLTGPRNALVGGDRDVSSSLAAFLAEQADFNAPLPVHFRCQSREDADEFVF